MSRTNDAEEFLNWFSGGMPSILEERYEVLECLSDTEPDKTFLMRRRSDGKLTVAKSYPEETLSNKYNEKEILARLHHDGLPEYVETIEADGMVYVLREYIEGQPLDHWREQHTPTEHQVIEYIIKICDVLSHLHSQVPPVIHRDIKPSNIILNKDKIYIIDFGISRLYDIEDDDQDTVPMGTQGFVSPEQYGFLQTDGRSDIYSLGVVLYYLLTGEITLKKENIANKNLWRIISKCTAFSPKDRYNNTGALKKALVYYQKRVKQRAFAVIIAALSACIMLGIGFAVGRYTDILHYSPVHSYDEYIFAEPLIEEAVRLTLGKFTDEPVLRKDLELIKELYISGDEIVLSERAYELIRNNPRRTVPENIKSLEDIKYMPNLIKLCMDHQSVFDLSPLSGHQQLEVLKFERCNISDVSPLLTVPRLRELFIFDNIIDEFSYFQEMKSLQFLVIGDNPLKNIAELGDISHIEALNLHMTDIENLAGIEIMVNLRELWLRETAVCDFSPLDGLPKLSVIDISPDMAIYLDTLSREDIEIIISE